jgi:hypothetical protein
MATTEPLAVIKTPSLPTTGQVGMKEVLGIQEPYMKEKARLIPEISAAKGREAEARQAQQVTEAEGGLAATKGFAAAEKGAMQQYQTKLEKEPLPAFVPSKENSDDLATLFSLVSVIGMVVGGGGRENAQQAMSAMNGMLEGHQKGRADLYKQELSTFDKNFKSMVQKHAEFRKEMEDAVKLASTDKEAAMADAKLAAVKSGSNIVKAMLEQGRLLDAYKFVDESQAGVDKAVEAEAKLRADAAKEKQAERRHREGLAHAERMRKLADEHAEKMKREEGATFNYFTTPDGKLVAVNTKNPNDIRTLNMDLRDATKLGAKPTALKKDESMANFVKDAIGRPVDTSSAAILVGVVDFVGKLDKLKKASTELGNVTGLSVGVADRMNAFLRSNVPVDPQTGQQIITQEVLDQAWENAKTSKDYTSLSEKSKVLAKTELDTVMSYLQAKYGNRAPVAEFKAAQQAISRKNMDATAYQQVLNNEQQSSYERLAGRGFTAADYQKVKEKAETQSSQFKQVIGGEEPKKVSAAEVKAYADKYYLNDPKGLEKARAELKRQGFEE